MNVRKATINYRPQAETGLARIFVYLGAALNALMPDCAPVGPFSTLTLSRGDIEMFVP